MRKFLQKLIMWLLKPFLQPRPQGNPVQYGDLKKGDVLLKRTEAWESYLIMALDQGGYSHAALFDGEGVTDAGTQGVTRRAMFDDCDVYRFNGKVNPSDPVIDVAMDYVRQKLPYDYTALYLVGLLMVVRLITIPSLRIAVEFFGAILLAQIRKALEKMRREGKQAFTCSEFVATCYWDASDDRGVPFGLPIKLTNRHTPLWLPRDLASGHRESKAERLRRDVMLELSRVRPNLSEEQRRVQDAVRSMNSNPLNKDPIAGSPLMPAAFVSPGDLQHSPSLIFVGRYQASGR